MTDLAKKWGNFDEQLACNAPKWAKGVKVQIETRFLDTSFNFSSLIYSTSLHRTVTGTEFTRSIHLSALPLWEEATHHSTEFKAFSKDEVLAQTPEERTITTKFEKVNYLLKAYNNNELAAETDAEIMRVTHPPIRPRSSAPSCFWSQTPLQNRVLHKYMLKICVIEGLQDSIWQIMSIFLDSNRHTTVQDQRHYTSALPGVQNGSRVGERSQNRDKQEDVPFRKRVQRQQRSCLISFRCQYALIYSKSDRAIPATAMIIQTIRNIEGPIPESTCFEL